MKVRLFNKKTKSIFYAPEEKAGELLKSKDIEEAANKMISKPPVKKVVVKKKAAKKSKSKKK